MAENMQGMGEQPVDLSAEEHYPLSCRTHERRWQSMWSLAHHHQRGAEGDLRRHRRADGREPHSLGKHGRVESVPLRDEGQQPPILGRVGHWRSQEPSGVAGARADDSEGAEDSRVSTGAGR